MNDRPLRGALVAFVTLLAAGGVAGYPQAASASLVTLHDDITDAKQVLERAAETIKNAKGLRFDVHVFAEGENFAGYAPESKGSFRMLRPPGETAGWLMRATGSGRQNPKNPELSFDVAWTPKSTEWLDPDKKKVFERPGTSARDPRVSVASSIRVPNIVDPRPYEKELRGSTFTLEERETVDGVECYVVTIVQGNSRGSKVRWAIGVADLLPRRYENIFEGGNVEGKISIEFSGVKLAEDLTPEQLKVEVPDGFERDVVEAPKPPPPPPPTPEGSPEEIKGQPEEASEAAGASGDQANPTPPAGPEAGGSAPPAPKKPAHEFPAVVPDFELRTSKGEKVTGADLKGSVALLEFSGSWCIPARAVREELGELVTRFEGRPLKVYTMFVREKSQAEGATFFAGGGFAWPLLLDADAKAGKTTDKTARDFKVRAFPTLVLVGPDGAIAAVRESVVRGETVRDLGEEIEKLLPAAESR